MASFYTVLEYLGQDVKIPDNYSLFSDLHSDLLFVSIVYSFFFFKGKIGFDNDKIEK